MSAILGRVNLDGAPISPPMFMNAMTEIAPYGSDGQGCWIEGPVALAQSCKTDRATRCVQGPVAKFNHLTCVADVILDHREDTVSLLGLEASYARTLADDALIVRAYAKWGADCNRFLDGDYSFAIWDSDARSLFLSRDHIGTRPLYWRRNGDSIVFATDNRALVEFKDLAGK